MSDRIASKIQRAERMQARAECMKRFSRGEMEGAPDYIEMERELEESRRKERETKLNSDLNARDLREERIAHFATKRESDRKTESDHRTIQEKDERIQALEFELQQMKTAASGSAGSSGTKPNQDTDSKPKTTLLTPAAKTLSKVKLTAKIETPGGVDISESDREEEEQQQKPGRWRRTKFTDDDEEEEDSVPRADTRTRGRSATPAPSGYVGHRADKEDRSEYRNRSRSKSIEKKEVAEFDNRKARIPEPPYEQADNKWLDSNKRMYSKVTGETMSPYVEALTKAHTRHPEPLATGQVATRKCFYSDIKEAIDNSDIYLMSENRRDSRAHMSGDRHMTYNGLPEHTTYTDYPAGPNPPTKTNGGSASRRRTQIG